MLDAVGRPCVERGFLFAVCARARARVRARAAPPASVLGQRISTVARVDVIVINGTIDVVR